MSSSVKLVPITEPEKVWILAKPFIQKVIDRYDDAGDIDEIYDEILSKERQLWMVLKDGEIVASVLTRIYAEHGKLYGLLTHAGGQGCEDWFHIVNPIGEFFKSEGCVKFFIHGRKGWKKYLKDFSTRRLIYEKDL